MPALLQEPGLPGGYGVVLLEALISLGAVCLLAWVLLRWASRLQLGTARRTANLEVLERLTLDPRRSLVLVRVGEEVLLLGLGEGAAPRLLKQLSADAPLAPSATERRSFAEVLAGLRRGDPDPPADDPSERQPRGERAEDGAPAVSRRGPQAQ